MLYLDVAKQSYSISKLDNKLNIIWSIPLTNFESSDYDLSYIELMDKINTLYIYQTAYTKSGETFKIKNEAIYTYLFK